MLNNWVDISVYAIADLEKGAKIIGPSILTGSIGTTYIPNAWEGELDTHLNFILIHRHRDVETSKALNKNIELELFTNRFRSVADKMGLY